MNIKKIIITAVLAVGLSACTVNNNSIYYWGSYSQTAYKLKSAPTDEVRSKHKAELMNIVTLAATKKKKIPPGIYAELALLEAEDKNLTLAMQYFEEEKRLFPESEKLIQLIQMNMAKEASK
ncbi:MAG: DUF4810 domain-containing protein [Paraglaciecola sp.]|uniref:DUF4810 domain-containing protein n=1 Tax=Alishewanella maricola TaxID=2795740 RepID=A0ABS8C284_9ALTE|nr:DUF4810 domain-containing protein [Alishewanella maricola]MCB5226436.1 DUF4810 domain-containing protein [Alishewanella maricola]MDP4944453.1 DUF4810 domain-containing protein [Alishewanella sp.]MDP5132369.1 DUF4810 domain-containing protein [Paraglaciecola sp.]